MLLAIIVTDLRKAGTRIRRKNGTRIWMIHMMIEIRDERNPKVKKRDSYTTGLSSLD